jgi:hypothetical protein
MGRIYDLRMVFKEHPTALGLLEFLVQDALLHWSEEERERAKETIKKKYNGKIVSAFMGDNQIFIELRSSEGEKATCYLLDVPATYMGKPAVVHPFRL